MGPHTVLIKKGEHGCLLFREDRMFSAPGLPMPEVVDPTGAGDSFAAVALDGLVWPVVGT